MPCCQTRTVNPTTTPLAISALLLILHLHLQTREYLSQPDFQTMIQNLNRNPGSMNAYLADPRFQVCVLLSQLTINTAMVFVPEHHVLCSVIVTLASLSGLIVRRW